MIMRKSIMILVVRKSRPKRKIILIIRTAIAVALRLCCLACYLATSTLVSRWLARLSISRSSRWKWRVYIYICWCAGIFICIDTHVMLLYIDIVRFVFHTYACNIIVVAVARQIKQYNPLFAETFFSGSKSNDPVCICFVCLFSYSFVLFIRFHIHLFNSFVLFICFRIFLFKYLFVFWLY